MTRRIDYRPFMKPSVRGSSYCLRGGRWWIHRSGSTWHLICLDREPTTVARFSTLAAAARHYREFEAA